MTGGFQFFVFSVNDQRDKSVGLHVNWIDRAKITWLIRNNTVKLSSTKWYFIGFFERKWITFDYKK